MNTVSSLSKLNFFKAQKYNYKNNHTVDNSDCPRPHFCMGFLLEGQAEFFDCIEKTTITLYPGEIIFVPISSRYISNWSGNPDVSYISMHFSFDFSSIFSRQRHFLIQKITCSDVNQTKDLFSRVLLNHNKSEPEMLSCLSLFFDILATILPDLKTKKTVPDNPRIKIAIDYIEQNFTQNISIDMLAKMCNMSSSRFFPAFKNTVGLTPIEYIQNHRINHAIALLLNNHTLSIENISDICGFESSSYFRRVFKKITGKSPREYRKSLLEI